MRGGRTLRCQHRSPHRCRVLPSLRTQPALNQRKSNPAHRPLHPYPRQIVRRPRQFPMSMGQQRPSRTEMGPTMVCLAYASPDSLDIAYWSLATLTPDLLPLIPTITPAYAVGGVLLILTGLNYTLIGIKEPLLHVFLSAAYLAAISVTVLILYVMNPPVSNAIQGAYLVAVVVTGLIVGVGAVVFSEMTEGLGCLLGGFCIAMWLLCLKPGGLITNTSGKAVFIAGFTIAGFAASFSHYTRDIGLIVGISISGATAVMLGVDCFSRAGLKEFWAYLWDLNTNLFPLGATTYPLTKGLTVELAMIVVIFLAGIVSQMKLWRIIKEHRARREEEREEQERQAEREERSVGRRVERGIEVDRNKWEAAYGDRDMVCLFTSRLPPRHFLFRIVNRLIFDLVETAMKRFPCQSTDKISRPKTNITQTTPTPKIVTREWVTWNPKGSK